MTFRRFVAKIVQVDSEGLDTVKEKDDSSLVHVFPDTFVNYFQE